MLPLHPYRRPALFITASGTDVGKTVATASLAAALHSLHVNVGLLKPIASGCPKYPDKGNAPDHALTDDDLMPLDSLLPANAIQLDTTNILQYLSPLRYAAPISPHLAAELESRPPHWPRVQAALDHWQQHCDFLLIEGAGGWLTPLDAHDHTIADLAQSLNVPILLVTTPTLGSINTTLLTVESIRHRNLKIAGLILNRVPPTNQRDLTTHAYLTELSRLAALPLLATLPESPFTTTLPQPLVNALLPYAKTLATNP